MNHRHSTPQTLIDELREAGADPAEAAALGGVARQLKTLPRPTRPAAVNSHQLWASIQASAHRNPAWRYLLPIPAAVSLALMGAATLAFAAQQSLPGDFLYPIKQSLESVEVRLIPGQRSTLAVRQSKDIKQSVEKHPNNPRPALTPLLNNLQHAATSHQLPTNKNDQEQIRQNLEEAQRHTSGSLRATIDRTLQSVEQSERSTTPPATSARQQVTKSGQPSLPAVSKPVPNPSSR